MHAHAPRLKGIERFSRGDCERLYPRRILGPPRYMHLGCADAGGHPAMRVAFEKSNGLLPRRVIAERDMDVRIDETGYGDGAAGIDGDIAAGNLATVSDRFNISISHHDCIAGHDRCRDLARENPADIDDGEAHVSRPFCA